MAGITSTNVTRRILFKLAKQSSLHIRSTLKCIYVPIFIALLASCLADCPEGWNPHKDFCMRLTKVRSRSFDLAERSCRKLHPSAHLASIHDEDENNVAYIISNNQTVWIGLKHVKDRWRWSDRTYVDFTNWLKEPTAPTNDTCAQMNLGTKWTFEIPCGTKKKTGKKGSKESAKEGKGAKSTPKGEHYKRSVRLKRTSGDPQALCKVSHIQTCSGPDWIRAGQFCYNFSSPINKKTWNDASASCLETDAKFVAIFNSRQNDVLRRLAHLTASNIWLGLIHTADGFHRWADGAIMTYDNFAVSDHYDVDHKCVFMDESSGQWLHESCLAIFEFVCMRPKLQLYDTRTANNSRPRATVEIWRRIEEALVPARAPPKTTTKKPSTEEPIEHQDLRTSLKEEIDEGSEKLLAGMSADSEEPEQSGGVRLKRKQSSYPRIWGHLFDTGQFDVH